MAKNPIVRQYSGKTVPGTGKGDTGNEWYQDGTALQYTLCG
jgi:hypothetical protein